MKHKSYMASWGYNQYRVYHWDERVQAYRESASMNYWQARASVGTANCRNPKTCTKPSHFHVPPEPEMCCPDCHGRATAEGQEAIRRHTGL